MVYEADLDFLEDETDLDSSVEDLDTLAVLDAHPEPPKPDPEEMLPLLSDAVTARRMMAARAFCEIQDVRAIPHLIALLTDPCPLVRVAATYALGRNPSLDAVEPLISQLDRDWNGYVRKGIVWALGNCRDLRTLKPLLRALKLDISAVRLWAASALGQAADLGYDAVIATVPPIIEALINDPLAAVRSNCAWSLGRLCRELPSNVVYATAVDALIQVLEDDGDLGVRDDAKAALLKLGDTRGIQAIENLELEII
ncbi:HEAT repeat domain-containing protein [Chamaesiphon sp. GL140_3_metabinner_50]|uniref:HEAT repeat domain-containing protein n=1 Tax=Chamaesiphon sp. GL140_3_metabinner_50 TaxID=2970812 RepID=UPI0025F08458|nr:HEAT repeat domain-containing protein [Chamaesiphon sp. GL140_3_metabinner_50]